MTKKVQACEELSDDDIGTVPDMDLDSFIDEVTTAYRDALERKFDSIVIAIDTSLDNTYYINDTPDGFQCDLWGYYFDDLEDIVSQLYDEMHGNMTDIRIE